MADKIKPEEPEAFYGSLFDNTPDGLAYCQMVFTEQKQPVDFIYLKVNKNFEKLTGLKDVEGKKVSELIPGIITSNPELFEIYGRVALGGKPEKFETYVKPLARWFLVSVYSPKKEFFTAVFQNITSQKQVSKDLENSRIAARNVLEDLQVEKEKLAEAKAKDEAVLASIGDGLIITDKQGMISVINHRTEEMIGWSVKDLLGKPIFDAIPMEDEKNEFIPAIRRALDLALSGTTTTTTTTGVGGQVIIATVYFIRKDKTKFPVAVTTAPIRSLDGSIIGVVAIFRDITKEKEIDKAKTEFVSLASHQLRTPLTSINWYIEMLQAGDAGALNDKQGEFLSAVYKGSRRMVQLVSDLLNVSRLETGRLKIEPVPTDLVSFIGEVEKEIKPLILESGCKISFDFPGDKISKVNVDKILLRQVIINLLTNAIRYSSGGKKGEVKVSVVAGPAGYRFSVKDNGIGVPESAKGRIFEKFFRADNARTAVADGNGLGLYLSKQIMEAAGGAIGLDSTEKGTTFFITIPQSGMMSKQGEKGLE